MNTIISYIYRDASNYKKRQRVIVKGEVSKSDEQAIYESLNEGLYFIPRQVGLPEERFDDSPTEDDHCWFEMEEGSFEYTELPPTENITAAEVVKAFQETNGAWDDVHYAIVA